MLKNNAFNKCFRFGNVVEIDPKLIVLVDVDGTQLAQLPVTQIGKASMVEIKNFMKGKIAKYKNKKDADFNH